MIHQILSEGEWNIIVAVAVGILSAAAYIFLGPGSGNTEL